MAAILALVFVPTLAAILFMLGGVQGDVSASTVFATTVFVALATGVVAGLFKLARRWDADPAVHR